MEPGDTLWVDQMNCYAFTDAGAVLRTFAQRLSKHHGLEISDEIDRVTGALAAKGGEHLWVLDDLTYLSTKPDDTVSALRLVDTLMSASSRAGLRARIVITSRQGDRALPGFLALEPLEWPAASEMAQRMADAAHQSCSLQDLEFGARRLHRMARGMPALYKRAIRRWKQDRAIARGPTPWPDPWATDWRIWNSTTSPAT